MKIIPFKAQHLFGLSGLLLLWEHWLTVKFEQSTVKLIGWALKRPFTKKGSKMSPSDTVKLGTVGVLTLGFSGGKATLAVTAAVDNSAVVLTLNVGIDSKVFVEQLFAAIEAKAAPGTKLIEEEVKSVIEAAVASIA